MILVAVDEIFLSNNRFVVLLKGDSDERSLPIFIGAAEAQAIAVEIYGTPMSRPLTHDLLKNVLDCTECRLMKIEVCRLEDSTFYARLILDRDGMETEMDCRPSDAIALALRCGAPIYVDQKVMDEAGQIIETPGHNAEHGATQTSGSETPPKGTVVRPEKGLSHMEVLKRDLDKAVVDERYEDAARLRDEITRLKHTHTKN